MARSQGILKTSASNVHPFGVLSSEDNTKEAKESTGAIADDPGLSGNETTNTMSCAKLDRKLKISTKTSKAHVFMAFVLFIHLGTMACLIWNIVEKGKQIDNNAIRIKDFEKDIKDYISRIATLEKELATSDSSKNNSPNLQEMSTTLLDRTAFVSVANTNESLVSTAITTANPPSSKATIFTSLPSSSSTVWSSSITSTSITTPSNIATTSTTPIPVATTTKTTQITTTAATTSTVTPLTTTVDEPTAFQVLKTQETTYVNYSFLALQVKVPIDGLSVTENWCRDYENLCKRFGRRPTGCGGSLYINSRPFKECRGLYNSDMDNDNVLGCTPAGIISKIANNTFSEEPTTPVGGYNSFGFLFCTAAYCKNTIKDNSLSLSSMQGALNANGTIMYTVCR